MRTARRLAVALVTAIIAVLNAAPAAAHSDGDDLRAEVYSRLGEQIDDVQAIYVILVDKSGSMLAENRYGRVADALREFLHGIGPRDLVALYTFDANVTPVFPTGLVTDPDAVVDLLLSGGLPRDGAPTDIGRALAQAVDDLSRTTSEVRSVVLISDGQQEPVLPDYDPSGTSQAWTDLRQRAAELTGVAAYALEIGSSQSGVALGYVFPDAVVLPAATPDLISSVLGEAKQSVIDTKVAAVLEQDPHPIVQIEWPTDLRVDRASGRATVTATIRSMATYVPLSVTDIRVTVDGLDADVAPIEDVELAEPGETKQLVVDLTWTGDRPLLDLWQTTSIEINATAAITSRWAPYLTTISADVSPLLQTTSASVTVDSTGYVGLPLLVGVMAALIGAIVLVRWLGINRRMEGVLLACQDPTDASTFMGKARLSGWSGRVHGPGKLDLNGEARVRHIARPWWSRRPRPAVYRIIFSHEGDLPHTDTGSCPVNGSVLVNGVRFCHVRDPRRSAIPVTCSCWTNGTAQP